MRRARGDVEHQQRPCRPGRRGVVGEVRVKVRDVLVIGAELEPTGVQRSGRGADHVVQRQRGYQPVVFRSGVALRRAAFTHVDVVDRRSRRPVTPPRAFPGVLLVRVGLSALPRTCTHPPGRARAPLRRPRGSHHSEESRRSRKCRHPESCRKVTVATSSSSGSCHVATATSFTRSCAPC